MTPSPSLVKMQVGHVGSVTAKTVSTTNISVSPLPLPHSYSDDRLIHGHFIIVIVFENGKSGFLGEHSCMDGTPTLRMTEFIIGALTHNKIDLGPARTESTGSSLPAPTEITFTIDAKTKANIAQAEKDFDELVGQHDMEVLHYEGYGKEYIKKFKTSPDAWAQLVKQLAFQKMYGRPGVCYESAQTRKYKLRRTEVIRSASNESKKWAESMLDPEVSVSCLP